MILVHCQVEYFMNNSFLYVVYVIVRSSITYLYDFESSFTLFLMFSQILLFIVLQCKQSCNYRKPIEFDFIRIGVHQVALRFDQLNIIIFQNFHIFPSFQTCILSSLHASCTISYSKIETLVATSNQPSFLTQLHNILIFYLFDISLQIWGIGNETSKYRDLIDVFVKLFLNVISSYKLGLWFLDFHFIKCAFPYILDSIKVCSIQKLFFLSLQISQNWVSFPFLQMYFLYKLDQLTLSLCI